jgi:hypothetical protein
VDSLPAGEAADIAGKLTSELGPISFPAAAGLEVVLVLLLLLTTESICCSCTWIAAVHDTLTLLSMLLLLLLLCCAIPPAGWMRSQQASPVSWPLHHI